MHDTREVSPRSCLNQLQTLYKNPSCDPWIFEQTDSHRYIDKRSKLYQSVSPPELLKVLLSLVTADKGRNASEQADIRVSACQRFCIAYHRPVITESQLFVQHRDDYFASVELYIDGQLSIKFREPLWQRLQKNPDKENGNIQLLTECIEALQRNSHWHRVQSKSFLKGITTRDIQSANPAPDDLQSLTG